MNTVITWRVQFFDRGEWWVSHATDAVVFGFYTAEVVPEVRDRIRRVYAY